MPTKIKIIFAFSMSMFLLFIAGMPEEVMGKTETIPKGVVFPKGVIPSEKPVNTAVINTTEVPKNIISSKPKKEIITKKPLPKAIDSNNDNNKFNIRTKHLIGRSIINFPWENRVAASIFTRGQKIWIIFNDKANIDKTALDNILPPFIDLSEILPSKTHTILRLHSNVPIYIQAQKVKGGNDWNITMSRRNKTPRSTIITSIVTGSSISPHVLISTFETAKPIRIKDPDVEDVLTIIPLYHQDTGIFPARRFVDFKILRSAQGIAIESYRDKLDITKLQNGIRIAAKGYTTLSSDLPEPDINKLVNNENSSGTLFPYHLWKARNATDFLAKRKTIIEEISKVDHKERMQLRLKLTKLFLAEGFHSEALGILNIIRHDDREFYSEYQLAALRGAANFMMYRMPEAESDFASRGLVNEQEIQIWRSATATLLGKQSSPYTHLRFDNLYAKHYPPKMRQRFAIIAADRAISLEKFDTAQKIIEKMQEGNVFKGIPDYADYMIGRLHAANNDIPRAIAILEEILDRTDDRFIESHADFTLATAVYNDGNMTKDDFIKRLERIRLLWRGDSLEINVLNILGELYVSQGKHLEGLRAWKEIMSYYPFTMNAAQIASRMAETFIELFNEGKADDMKPLNALALYYEFRELTPIGDAGDLMVQNLADRLAEIDLLNRAAALLEHQVKHRLEGEERSKIGARLALLYLLNRQPEKTISSLELTGYGNNDEMLESKRRFLAARAYNQNGQSGIALDMIADDYSIEAKQIRLDIYWNDKDWDNLIPTAEDIISSRKDITANLTDSEVHTLLRLAIAYTFENDTLQLQYLRDYFTPLISNHPLKDSFLYITNDKGIITPDNIATIAKNINQIQDFLSNYRKSVRVNGLSSMF